MFNQWMCGWCALWPVYECIWIYSYIYTHIHVYVHLCPYLLFEISVGSTAAAQRCKCPVSRSVACAHCLAVRERCCLIEMHTHTMADKINVGTYECQAYHLDLRYRPYPLCFSS